MNYITPVATLFSLFGLLVSSAIADRAGNIPGGPSRPPSAHKMQQATPMAKHVPMNRQIQSGVHNRALSPTMHPYPHKGMKPHYGGHKRQMTQHYQSPLDRQIRQDGFHVEFKGQHGKGSFGRYHQQYYPWAAYPYSYYYYRSAPNFPSVTPDYVDPEEQAQQPPPKPPHEVKPKILKILPDGTVIDRTPKSDEDKDKSKGKEPTENKN